MSGPTGLRSWDLRGVDGVYLRLKQRDGESEEAWLERRREHDRRAQTLKTYMMDRADYEEVPKAQVVITPGTIGGRPRIDGTRLAVSQLLIDLSFGDTVESISRERDHLPPGWMEAIIEWVDSFAVEEMLDE